MWREQTGKGNKWEGGGGGVTHLDTSDVNEDVTVVFDHATI